MVLSADMTTTRDLFTFLLAVAAVAPSCAGETSQPEPRVYAGPALPYSGFVRSSQYVEVDDHTRIALDVFRPTAAGALETAPLPVLFMQTQYRRAWSDAFGNPSYLPDVLGFLDLVKHGYVVACADARGEGASFGTRRGPWSQREAQDAHDVIEWIASQPWSNGKVGMFGMSYMGGIQLLAAGKRPPHLVSIMPGTSPFSQFDVLQTVVPEQGPFGEPGDPSETCLLGQCDNQTLPVDEDDETQQLERAAIAEHRANLAAGPLPYRDSISSALGVEYYKESSPSTYLTDINASGVSVYMWSDANNWLSQGTILNYVNIQVPHKKLLLLGPDGELDLIAEHARWFDATLKGIDNGILRDPPVTYYTAGAGYRSATSWPPAPVQSTRHYLATDASGLGALSSQRPAESRASDRYQVVYGISSLSFDLDARGLSYTSEPLAADTELTGYPIVHLWVSSDAPDGDFVGWLEDVDAWGTSTPVLDPLQGPAKLRASLRSTASPPFDNLGLPWHRGAQADVQPMTGAPVELVFDMLFVSQVFPRGHRIRFTLTGANPDTPQRTPAPTIEVQRSADLASYVELPIVTR